MVTPCDLSTFLDKPGALLDVRSPAEFEQGHIPAAISVPLFSDAERAEVGTCYKQQGRDAAVELGVAIASPKLPGLITTAKQLAPDRRVRLHCWRGGMRSGAVAWLLETAGFQVATLAGGYKAFRRWALQAVELPRPIVIVGGMTGSGKTDILQALATLGEQVVDLEAIAHHRGSSFGALGLPPQPSNEQFENELAVQWAQCDPQRVVWLEAESKRVGRCRIPEALFQQMMQAPVLEVVRSRDERLALLVDMYGTATTEDLILATERIRKRLGGLRTQQAVELLGDRRLSEACDVMLHYYDKTYTYDLQQRHVTTTPVDITGLSAEASASRLLQEVQAVCPQPLRPSSVAASHSSLNV